MPPVSMSAPARMKSGSESRTKESTWCRMVCTVTASGTGAARTAPT